MEENLRGVELGVYSYAVGSRETTSLGCRLSLLWSTVGVGVVVVFILYNGLISCICVFIRLHTFFLQLLSTLLNKL